MDPSLSIMMEELPLVRRYARHLTRSADAADDLAQDVALLAFEHLHSWQPGTNMRAWLLRIAHNKFVSSTRRQRFSGRFDEHEVELRTMHPPAQDKAIELRDVLRAIERLRPKQRQILLAAIGGDKYATIAAQFDIPVGTVRSRLARARAALAVDLGRRDGAERRVSCDEVRPRAGESRVGTVRRRPTRPAESSVLQP